MTSISVNVSEVFLKYIFFELYKLLLNLKERERDFPKNSFVLFLFFFFLRNIVSSVYGFTSP